MTAKILKAGGILLFSILVAACGGGGSTSSSVAASVQTMTLPTLPGDPHSIDFYNPGVATRAVIFLHGALGTNYGMANDLGINTSTGLASTATADWSWLNANKILAVFPQGQALDTTLPLKYTWSNRVMNSGVDDLAFLQALALYISSHYGITDIYLAGHSNGGMMVNRVWCESPATFKGYISMSGPASDYYLTTPCNPGAAAKPYYGIVGGQDNVLQIAGNWGNPTWTIAPAFDPGSTYMPDPILINEWNQQRDTRIPALCPGDPISASGVIDTNNVETWDNCSGKLKLQKVISSGHSISELELNSGQQMRNLVMAFINQLP